MRFAVEIDDQKIGPKTTAEFVAALVSALYQANLAYLRENKTAPLLLSGVKYEPQAALSSVDRFWFDVPTALREGRIDCKGAAAWYAAEETLRGRPTVPVVIWADRLVRGEAVRMFHVLTRDARGVMRDPSISLGMRER